MRYLFFLIFCGRVAFVNAQNQIAIDLTTDQFGSETIWQIDGAGGGFFENGGGFPDQPSPGSYPQSTRYVDLPDGTYSFCLSDAYEDGFCCAFGQGSLTITHVASGTVLFHTDTFSTGIVCTQLTVPFSRVQGTLFLDDDHDCIKDPNELALPGQIIKVEPGDHYALTRADGSYEVPLPYGTYEASVSLPTLLPVCPPSSSIPFTLTDILPFAEVNMGDTSISRLDLVAAAASGPARPGFAVHYVLSLANASHFVSGPITATYVMDPLLSFISSDPTPTTVSGGVLTWELQGLGAFEQVTMDLDLQMPADPGLIGEILTGELSGYQSFTEQDLDNNVYIPHTLVTGSLDPNEKVAWPREVFDLGVDSVVNYTIRFQNTGTDTAFTVVITDTLEADLDMATFEQGASSHPVEVAFRAGRVVKWTFNNILLPDSNTNEAASHGLVNFRIRPVQPILPGTVIANTANIYFDFNPPVITDTSLLVAEFSTAQAEGPGEVGRQLTLFPNPTTDELQVIIGDAGVGAHTADVLSLDGRLLMHIGAISRTARISTAWLAAGAYVLRLRNAEGRTQQASFMKR